MEEEERYRLKDEEVALLAQYPHALDYKFTEEQIKFLENNGYLLLPVSYKLIEAGSKL